MMTSSHTKREEGTNIARKTAIIQKPPTIPPERALRALTEQLEALQKLKGRRYDEVDAAETEWMHLTRSIIEAAFGEPSSSLDEFLAAAHAGAHFVMGYEPIPRPQLEQENFHARIRQFDALLKALINTLRLHLPEEEIKGVYAPGQEYDFYRDLNSLVATATREVFIVDAYLDEEVFNLYVAKIPAAASVRILSSKLGSTVVIVAKKYASGRPLELRTTTTVHDRVLFVDQRGWIIGQSIKDAARKKPTYVIELEEPSLTAERDIHDNIWTSATSAI